MVVLPHHHVDLRLEAPVQLASVPRVAQVFATLTAVLSAWARFRVPRSGLEMGGARVVSEARTILPGRPLPGKSGLSGRQGLVSHAGVRILWAE